MDLLTEFAAPIELSTVARKSLADYEKAKGSLAEILPNTTSNSRIVRYSLEASGLAETATFRSFDAESAIGSSQEAVASGIAELPALSQKLHITELDLIDGSSSTSSEFRRAAAGRRTVEVARAVSDAVEVVRGQALQTGRITIDERGFKAAIDFQRPDELNATAPELWTNRNADVFDQLLNLVNLFTEANGGEAPAKIIASTKVVTLLMRNLSVIATVSGVDQNTNSVPSRMVSQEAINTALVAFGFPPIEVYDRRVNRGGQLTRVLDEDTIILVAEGAGRTVWGPTAEANEANYGMAAEERAGIAVGAYKTNDPVTMWVKAAATVLPILSSGTRSMSYKVA